MHKFQKILLATDFSWVADHTFLMAVHFFQMFGSKLYIFHVIVSNERITRYASSHVLTDNNRVNNEIPNILVPINYSDYYIKTLARAKPLVYRYKERLSSLHNFETDTDVIVGQPVYQILNFIKNDEPDLVFISVHGLSDRDDFKLDYHSGKVITGAEDRYFAYNDKTKNKCIVHANKKQKIINS